MFKDLGETHELPCETQKQTDKNTLYVSSGFRREVYEIYALLGYYAACSGYSLPTFREKVSAPKRRYGIVTTFCVIAPKSTVLNSIFKWMLENYCLKDWSGIASLWTERNTDLWFKGQ
jgi:hypothetical protein